MSCHCLFPISSLFGALLRECGLFYVPFFIFRLSVYEEYNTAVESTIYHSNFERNTFLHKIYEANRPNELEILMSALYRSTGRRFTASRKSLIDNYCYHKILPKCRTELTDVFFAPKGSFFRDHINEPTTDKTYNKTCATSGDSDQPAYRTV